MPRKLIKKYLPDHRKVRTHKNLQCFGKLLHDPNIWHLNRRSVSGAFAVGLFVAFVPIPLQMILAAAIAIVVRVNLPISISLVWITNPITIPPMFYFSYKTGARLLDTPLHDIKFELSVDWLMAELGAIWEPFLFGCFILGLISGALGFMVSRLLWRIHIFQYVKKRRLRRKQKRAV